MDIKKLLEFLKILEQLKCNTRHSWTSSGRQESVAEHSWRLAVMAMMVGEEFKDLDMDKVIRMCLIHDWGEAVTGDIPAFVKTLKDEAVEDEAVFQLAGQLPEPLSTELADLFDEMKLCESKEAKLCKALDKIETLIQHNEAGIHTWLPLEFEMNLIYGDEIAAEFPYTKALKDQVRQDSLNIIKESRKESRT